MNVSKINNSSFKGLLTIVGPDKESNMVVNTDNISTLSKSNYIDKKENSALGLGNKQGTIITMNNGANINTYLPMETVVDTYKQAVATGNYKLETQFNPVMTTKLL